MFTYAHYYLEQYPFLHSRYFVRDMKSAPPGSLGNRAN